MNTPNVDVATKTRIKLAKARHALHVALLMERLDLTKADAAVMAYLDGYGGFEARLNPPTSPSQLADQGAADPRAEAPKKS